MALLVNSTNITIKKKITTNSPQSLAENRGREDISQFSLEDQYYPDNKPSQN